MDNRGARLTYLDGLRGWAALSVVIFHSTWEMFGHDLRQLRSTWPGPLNDGQLAVSIFFILSGLVLTAGTSGPNGRARLRQMAAGRYFRLTIPILGACLIGYLLMVTNLLFNSKTKDIMDNFWVWQPMSDQVPSLTSFISYSLYRVYFSYISTSLGYNAFLWTMPIELFGSLMLFGTIGLFRKWRSVRIGAFVVAAVAANMTSPAYALFFYGALLSEFTPAIRESLGKNRSNLVGIVSFAVGFLISVYFRQGYDSITGTLIVFGVMTSYSLQSFMQFRISQWLGHISFPLYLVHCYILFGPACWLVIQLHALRFGLSTTAAIVCPFSVLASLALAQAFLPVEAMAISIAHTAGSFAAFPRPPSHSSRG